MKATKYFLFRRTMEDRKEITDEWIKYVVENPFKTIVQDDGRIRKWARIESAAGRWLRVVLLQDAETIHNAFFDRDFEE